MALTCPAELGAEPWAKAMGYHKGPDDSLVGFGHIQEGTPLYTEENSCATLVHGQCE